MRKRSAISRNGSKMYVYSTIYNRQLKVQNNNASDVDDVS